MSNPFVHLDVRTLTRPLYHQIRWACTGEVQNVATQAVGFVIDDSEVVVLIQTDTDNLFKTPLRDWEVRLKRDGCDGLQIVELVREYPQYFLL